MYNSNSGDIRSHPTAGQQSHLFDFLGSLSFSTIPETLITSTKGLNFLPNPDYKCNCKRGYSLYNDPFNDWKLQGQTEDYGRKEIEKTYRLPKGGF